MRYRRLDGSDPGGTVSFDVPGDTRTAASAKAGALRDRAQRYRALAGTFYNSDIIAEVETLACELEDEAADLEIVSLPFFRAA